MPDAGVVEWVFLVFIRLLAVMGTAPLFSHRAVAMPVKIGLAGGLALLLAVAKQDSLAGFAPEQGFLLAVINEIIVGVAIGFTSMLVFYAVEMAGGIIGSGMGFNFPSLLGPVFLDQSAVVQQFYALMAILIFMSVNGHHAFLLALDRTLTAVPPGSFVVSGGMIEAISQTISSVIISAVQLSFPVMATLVLTDLALALTNRVMPQMPVFIVGMPLKVGVGLVMMVFTWSLMAPILERLLLQAPRYAIFIVR
ncbi:MAG: flagellar biosynthetic protein FliR [Anaerolineae bacterium]